MKKNMNELVPTTENNDKYEIDMYPEERLICITDDIATDDFKLLMVDAMLQPNFKNSEVIGEEFNCIGYMMRAIEIENEDGDIQKLTNCIFIDDEEQSYSTVSNGIARVVKTWAAIGLEPSIEHPIRIRFDQVQKGHYRYYTVKPVKEKWYYGQNI